MKKLFFFGLLVSLLASGSSLSQVPTTMSYQGYVCSPSGNPLQGSKVFVFRLYDAESGGTELWQETDTLEVTNGQFHAILGANNPLDPGDFSGQTLWFETMVDGHLLPTRQAVATVGYAFKAKSADEADHAITADTANVALNVTDPASSCLWQTDGTNVFRLNGKVGVGIDPSPSTTRFRVDATEGWTGYFTQSAAISDVRLAYEDGRGFYVNSKGTTNPYILRLAYNGNSIFDVHNNGNVGLGTASPEGKLHIVGSAAVLDNEGEDFKLFGAADDLEHNHYLKLLNATGLTSAWGLKVGGLLVSDYYEYADPGKNDLIVKGNVGVGTPTPSCMLELKKDVGSGTTLFKVSGYNGDANMVAIKANGTILTINQTGTNDSQKGLLINHAGPGYGAYVVGNTYMDGDLCVTGAKNAIVPTSRGMTKVYSEESAETWFTDYGSGNIINGCGHVELDPRFQEIVVIDDQHPMRVFVQQTSGKPVQIVVSKGIQEFDVICSEPIGEATFDYRIVAKRKGFENDRLETSED